MIQRISSLAIAAAFALGVIATPLAADAQAHPTASGPGSYLDAGGGVSLFESDYGQRYIGGGYVNVDMHPHWRFGLEAEGRWLRVHTDEGVTQSNYLIGPHVNIKEFGPMVVYGKFLVGGSRMVFPFNDGYGTFFTMAPGGGLDFRLGDRWTVRAPDFEYQIWQDFGTYGSLHPYGVSVGLTYRINGVDRYPKKNRPWRH
ncbi:Opacity protein [Bryocella elongata]|uniref:Opacity protein n=1 Tax=Bryocella elongata TaxID=863522 RepID=A0A1H5YHF8_9BACT|nr:outer membrane beta-barrel protein [Bryocella elongata]SEG23424.1 Opacity protein [Bryocella elongata]